MILDDRIIESFDMQDRSTELSFDLPAYSESLSTIGLRLDGYVSRERVAVKAGRIDLV